MDFSAIERSLRTSGAQSLLADPRLVRRVIKAHRGITGLGLEVPHARCYSVSRHDLCAIVGAAELGRAVETLPDDVILVARPPAGEVDGRSTAEVLARLWRAAFHASIHAELDRQIGAGALDGARVRERIDRIGQTEFDEVRAILRHDDLVLPPAGDAEALVELCAIYLELQHFAPHLLVRMFPGLAASPGVAACLAEGLDVPALLARTCPEGTDPVATVARAPQQQTAFPTFSAPPTLFGFGAPAPRPSERDAARLGAAADAARRGGNGVRAALLWASVARSADQAVAAKARAEARRELDGLAARLAAALRPAGTDAGADELAWTSLLLFVAEEAVARRWVRYPVEARLLFDLQHATMAHVQPHRAVDLVTWALSRGRLPIVRPLPSTREVRVARHLRRAAKKVRHVRVAAADRKLLAKLLDQATHRADDNMRAALRPKIEGALEAVGLRPIDVPERVARDKLVDELLDRSVSRGFFSLAHMRDALSQNQLKMGGLSGARELWEGDALLRADALLVRSLDGVYRGGEVYLRALQKLSSIAFGTQTGRLVTLYLVLPVGGAFVVLEGITHVVGPISVAIGAGKVHLLDTGTFVATTILIFALVHSESARAIGRRLLDIVGDLLRLLFLDVPRWVLTREPVRLLLASPAFRAVVRRVLVPLTVALAVYFLTPLRETSTPGAVGLAALLFVLTSLAASTRAAEIAAEVAAENVGEALRAMRRHVMPGLFRMIAGAFRALLELLERAIYKVDEWLRSREGEGRAGLVAKASLGVVWFLVAYVVRLYVTLLIEPELNPLKHFPVITVAHKLLLPFSPHMLVVAESQLAPLGSFIAGTIAATTVFLLPSVFGFLVWELKENWKLYRAGRSKVLRPARIGHHGETMAGLMVPGFHSGTLPKIHARMRRDAQREDSEAKAPASRAEGSMGVHREALAEVSEAVRSFVDRELAVLLARTPRWTHGPLEVRGVDLQSNRVRVRVACPALGPSPLAIAFEEQSGHVVASVEQAGFTDALLGPSRVVFENALAGLYHLAGVDLVREHLEVTLGGEPYDIADEGLVIWPGGTYRTEIVYALGDERDARPLRAIVRGEPLAVFPARLDPRAILFSQRKIAWPDWVLAFGPAIPGEEAVRRLIDGPPLLPSPPAVAEPPPVAPEAPPVIAATARS